MDEPTLDELTLVRELWAERAEPDADRLEPARRRLLAATRSPARSADAPARGRTGTRPRTQTRTRRRVALTAVGLAATVAAGVVAVEVVPTEHPPMPFLEPTEAAQVLNVAAVTAASEKWISPRPGQYLVVPVRESGGVMVRGVHGPELWPSRPSDYLSYYQVAGPYGATVSKVLEGRTAFPKPLAGRTASPKPLTGRPASPRALAGRPAPGHASLLGVTCPLSSPIRDTSYAAMVTWPTEPTALRAFLLTAAPASWWGGSVSVERRLWETASILLTSRPVPPKLRAGLFRVLAGVPGVRVVPGAASRHDVAVTRSYATGDKPVEQEQDALVFDRTTHRLLGSRAVTAARTGRYPAGTPLGSQTLGKITVVDHLPRGVELQTQCR